MQIYMYIHIYVYILTPCVQYTDVYMGIYTYMIYRCVFGNIHIYVCILTSVYRAQAVRHSMAGARQRRQGRIV